MSDKPAPKPDHPQQRKVFDVVRPGKTMASPSSRPLLSRQKDVADDQFVPSGAPAVPHGRTRVAAPADPEDRPLLSRKGPVVLTPVDPAIEPASAPRVPPSLAKRPLSARPPTDAKPTIPLTVELAAPAGRVDPPQAPSVPIPIPTPNAPAATPPQADDRDIDELLQGLDMADPEDRKKKSNKQPTPVAAPEAPPASSESTSAQPADNLPRKDAPNKDMIAPAAAAVAVAAETDPLLANFDADPKAPGAQTTIPVSPEAGTPDAPATSAPAETTAAPSAGEPASEPLPPAETPKPEPAPLRREDIMAGAGMNLIDNDEDHDQEDRRMVISHHKRKGIRWWGWLLIILCILAVLAAAADIALDAGWVSVDLPVPYTSFLD